tara:strand:+ start:242 stop:919 length:678 start_codon:yes stop_codon:yes gene_type:complete
MEYNTQTHNTMEHNQNNDTDTQTSYAELAMKIIKDKHLEKVERNIWDNSDYKLIKDLESDDVGKVGEHIIAMYCNKSQIPSVIDGIKTKQLGGGSGDGTIYRKTVEIKTARQGSKNNSFQHELGEVPWKAEYMIFLDISPDKMYITIFKNFTEEFYKNSGIDKSYKCAPYFPTKTITWRKQVGAFKLDTTVKINDKNVKNNYTFVIDETENDYSKFKSYVESIIK